GGGRRHLVRGRSDAAGGRGRDRAGRRDRGGGHVAGGAAMRAPASGPLRFARLAYPPNALGYCGPDDAAALLDHADAGLAGADLAGLARQFAGAWPYLQLIAASAGRPDPLDADVVEAYWLGNDLLRGVDARVFA